MAIRVLGYKSVVEAKGTWPTNYIAKAQELKVLEDVEYGKYTEGATRGNVALLMWNMLTTKMWDVTGENESNGLSYSSANGVTMIDKYFDDYTYIDEDEEVVVTDIEVADGKVKVELTSTAKDIKNATAKLIGDDLELARDVEFLNLFGRTVSVLYNDKDEEVVMLIPSNSDKVKADYKDELDKTKDGDYDFSDAKVLNWGNKDEDANLYTVAVLGTNKKVDYATYFNAENSFVVKETKMSKDTLKITTAVETSAKISEEDAIVLIDGEWASREDIKAGDVVTVLVANELYVVSRETVEGSFDDASDKFIKVEGKEYEYLLTTCLYEYDESKEEFKSGVDFDSLDKKSKYFDEDCTVYLNFLGEVVRVEFEEIKDEDDGDFYVLTNAKAASWDSSDKSGVTRYIELNGETYEVKTTATGYTDAKYDDLEAGSVVFVKFDDKDRVTDIEVMRTVNVGRDNTVTFATTDDDETATSDGVTYNVKLVNSELDDNYVGSYKVSSSTTVFTITPVEDEDDDIVSYDVEITKGQSALKGVETSLVVYKEGSTVASYAFVLEDAKNTDVQFGLIDEDGVRAGRVETRITIDGETYIWDKGLTVASSDEGKVIGFIENEEGINVKHLLAVSEVETNKANRIVVDEDDSNIFHYDVAGANAKVDLDDEKYEDYTFVLVSYEKYEDGTEEFTDVNTYTAEKLSVKDDDIYIVDENDNEVVYIVRGYEFPKDVD